MFSVYNNDKFEEFIKLMRDIGELGKTKYGVGSIQSKIERGDLSRTTRLSSHVIGLHMSDHFGDYLQGQKHDHFGTLKHQLAAVAFNAMMEFWLADLNEKEAS